MDKDFEYNEVETGLSAERALDIAATVANFVPLIGGPVSSIISGISGGRKEQRILEVLQGISDDLRDFKSRAAEEYVKTEDFEELLEFTLTRVAKERSSEKRQLYKRILTNAIKHPFGDYEEQLRFLKTLDEIDVSHIVVLRALLKAPEAALGFMGSPMQTLRMRIPGFSEGDIEQRVAELNDRRITSLASLRTMMTARGAADLQQSITQYGRSFLKFVEGA